MPSTYYLDSVSKGREFQKNNEKNWSGAESKNYNNQIRYLMDKYQAQTVLDYGCGKGLQYTTPACYGLDNGTVTEPMTFQERINATTVFKYDPCVAGLDQLPEPGTKFDAVICTQVLGSIPDADLEWLSELIASHATKFVFIGLHSPDKPVKSKKLMYDSAYLTHPRSIPWYITHFANEWKGPNLYWWFRDTEHPINNWYQAR